jgi:hypothetical protein
MQEPKMPLEAGPDNVELPYTSTKPAQRRTLSSEDEDKEMYLPGGSRPQDRELSTQVGPSISFPVPILPANNQADYQETDDNDDDNDEVPWLAKWTSLVAVMALPIGVNWADSALGPLRNTLRNEMGINNEQFGVISSADAIVNS